MEGRINPSKRGEGESPNSLVRVESRRRSCRLAHENGWSIPSGAGCNMDYRDFVLEIKMLEGRCTRQSMLSTERK